ncbi:MAG TPA: hypothetical protein VFB65_00870, partial [Pyrinomonadaceae bacterium]|nr:hypothetical protein [Pyrinomonadaceae bacterium]
MTFANHRTMGATQRRLLTLRAALLIGCLLLLKLICFAQDKPLTSGERDELLKLIRSLQERIDKLEAAQAEPASAPAATPSPTAAHLETKPDPSTSDDPHVWMPPVVKEKPASESADTDSYGRYT